MEIAVIGATGALGREVVREALARGHGVSALARESSRGRVDSGATVVEGDARQRQSLRKLVRGTDAVVSVLGPVVGSEVDLCSRYTRALLEVMAEEGVERLVYITGAMIGHPPERSGLVYRLIPRLFSASTRAGVEDRRLAERLVMASDRRWSIVRPPRLVDGPALGGVESGETIRIGSLARIRRADLARFLVDAVVDRALEGRAVAVVGR